MLPSKKVLSIFILVMAMVVAIIIAFGKDKSSTAINFASNLVAGDKISIPTNQNWQVELGNITVNIDPPKEEDITPPEETDTDIISRSLTANYLALKDSGKLDSTSAQKLIDQTTNYIGQINTPIIPITQLNVIADNGNQSMIDYGENLGNILKNNRPTKAKNEIDIITKAIESRDVSKINELDGVIETYKKITEELLKMPVPKTFFRAHLDMTNGMRNMALAMIEMKSVFNDPIKGLSALQLYQEGANMFASAIQATNTFISQNKIIYKQGSGGYYLLYGI
ncbi:MAG: hypothetical protein COV33_02455 [Candidatus Zambryskibacteria bacterium CG10_big_fil_rev_8_21_14_0_10_34_34]|uniref:Uncharacterized protein n=1 Tax=Candidatus Zambryskibacteria bacterium CG10_big_fil_rev_8_21_14_0_10_34_34 TaxID=1975114 RepID=A0A2H0R0A8_9BACT|nr:MAG: hypothetical protein COV33_02455 [Candidatus Zambryskibacteria bacterium CG10_big_fil_rev_8_21_14_0_10_34_34]